MGLGFKNSDIVDIQLWRFMLKKRRGTCGRDSLQYEPKRLEEFAALTVVSTIALFTSNEVRFHCRN
jgi:hypothetical protein